MQLAYASGGAGYAISAHLLGELAPKMEGCQNRYLRWAGDLRVGKCIKDLGVGVTPEVLPSLTPQPLHHPHISPPPLCSLCPRRPSLPSLPLPRSPLLTPP